jgi:hypothetical protein
VLRHTRHRPSSGYGGEAARPGRPGSLQEQRVATRGPVRGPNFLRKTPLEAFRRRVGHAALLSRFGSFATTRTGYGGRDGERREDRSGELPDRPRLDAKSGTQLVTQSFASLRFAQMGAPSSWESTARNFAGAIAADASAAEAGALELSCEGRTPKPGSPSATAAVLASPPLVPPNLKLGRAVSSFSLTSSRDALDGDGLAE